MILAYTGRSKCDHKDFCRKNKRRYRAKNMRDLLSEAEIRVLGLSVQKMKVNDYQLKNTGSPEDKETSDKFFSTL